MNPDSYQIKRALISVSNKNGIIDFARSLGELGIEIFSTGGTAQALKENGIEVKSVSELTGFPEIMEGRVKTLHPAVHAGLLADLDKEDHRRQLGEHNLASIDMLVVNLYPFEETLAKENTSHKDLIENIDIGGPAMLRAAAKNYRWTAPVVNPELYTEIVELMRHDDNRLEETYRRRLAGETFSHTAHYDAVISGYFNNINKIEFPNKISLSYPVEQNLRYGENPHQNAVLYGDFGKIFKKLHGKELSYNNIVDIDAAAKLATEFDLPACGIIKHTNPCGVGTAANLPDAFRKAFATDNVSPFGGIFVFNRPVDIETAKTVHDIFSEVIIAPEFLPEALELLVKKKNRRLIQADFGLLDRHWNNDFKSVAGGILMQNSDRSLFGEDHLKVVTKRQPTDEEMIAMTFAWKICKHVKSNTIVYTKSDRTLGIGAGQMSRVDSARIAREKALKMELELSNSVVASDAFFPFADGLLQAVEAGATAVIQPGGSIRDEEVIKAADDNNIAMVFTGMRHFRH
jgi:phosphoribosylaminoimidazolecarboxamide formyltransferase/IMP cyclohydrolase